MNKWNIKIIAIGLNVEFVAVVSFNKNFAICVKNDTKNETNCSIEMFSNDINSIIGKTKSQIHDFIDNLLPKYEDIFKATCMYIETYYNK